MLYYKIKNTERPLKEVDAIEIDLDDFMESAPEDFKLSPYGHGVYDGGEYTYFTFDPDDTNTCDGEPVTLQDALDNL